jgi:hypothetical protein
MKFAQNRDASSIGVPLAPFDSLQLRIIPYWYFDPLPHNISATTINFSLSA